MDGHVGFDEAQRRSHEKLVLVDGILATQQRDICAQRHFAEAIRVEVKLVLNNVDEMRVYRLELLERFAIQIVAQAAAPELNLKPHTLHVKEIVGVVAVLCEERHCALSHLPSVGAQRIASADSVEKTIRQVHFARNFTLVGCRRQITRVLEDTCLRQMQVNHCRCVLQRLVYMRQCLDAVPRSVVVVAQILEHPQDCDGGIDLRLAH